LDELTRNADIVREEMRQTQIRLLETEKELELLRQKHRNEQLLSSDHYNRGVEL
jgi:hypothetical protein